MISIRQVHKSFPLKSASVSALRGVGLFVERGKFSVLLGPSGSGKTTLLRCVAGLEKPDSGEIVLGDQVVYSGSRQIFVQPDRRGVGMVFQSYAIWPHMTVFDNVALPLLYGKKRVPRRMVRDRVEKALALVSLEGVESRPATLLSGGQQQRVALARALAIEPEVLLMDEPLSNLDARLREEIRFEIKSLVRKIGVTVLYVTHDQAEAMALADVVAVMHHGEILQMDSPDQLYFRPAAPLVANFFGYMNWLPGIVNDSGSVETEMGIIEVAPGRHPGRGERVVVGIRPEDVELDKNFSHGALENNTFFGEIISHTFLGDHRTYKVKVKDRMFLTARSSRELGGNVCLRIAVDRVHLFLASEIPPAGVQ